MLVFNGLEEEGVRKRNGDGDADGGKVPVEIRKENISNDVSKKRNRTKCSFSKGQWTKYSKNFEAISISPIMSSFPKKTPS